MAKVKYYSSSKIDSLVRRGFLYKVYGKENTYMNYGFMNTTIYRKRK